MLLLSHTITGAIIGQKIGDPWLVSFVALASHFILDWIPHWSYDIPRKFDPWQFLQIVPDIVPSILVYIAFLFAYPELWLTITLGVTFAILPDFMTLTSYVPGLRDLFKKLNEWHGRIQVHDEPTLGLITQAVYIGLLIIILIYTK